MRLDQELVARGLVETRSKARDLILRGHVEVDGKRASKPGAETPQSAHVTIEESQPHYVSRGGLKLAAALDHYGFSPADAVALDAGSSTGGFTDVLLRQRARHVYAVDVGRDQLHPSLCNDARVTVLQETDARTLDATLIPEPVTAIVSDVSFISLTQALPAAMQLATPGTWLIALIKPQFELDPKSVGKGGIVKSQSLRQSAIDRVTIWLNDLPGWRTRDVIPSPITGKGGNVEYLIGATFDG